MLREERQLKIISPFSTIEGQSQKSIINEPAGPSVLKKLPGVPESTRPPDFPRLSAAPFPITAFFDENRVFSTIV